MLLGEPWLRLWNPTINWQTKDMTFNDGVVWRAVSEKSQPFEKSRCRKWRPVGERRALHLILGDEEQEEAKEEAEIPEWL